MLYFWYSIILYWFFDFFLSSPSIFIFFFFLIVSWLWWFSFAVFAMTIFAKFPWFLSTWRLMYFYFFSTYIVVLPFSSWSFLFFSWPLFTLHSLAMWRQSVIWRQRTLYVNYPHLFPSNFIDFVLPISRWIFEWIRLRRNNTVRFWSDIANNVIIVKSVSNPFAASFPKVVITISFFSFFRT